MNYAHPRRWWAGSDFTPGRRRPLSREARRLWLARVELARRRGHVTALHVEIGRALLRRLGVDGRLDPSHAILAADAGCSDRTVRRALAALAALGLLAWQRRLVRSADGWRAEQTSNAYVLAHEGVAIPPRLLRLRCGGQAVRETPLESVSLPNGWINGPAFGEWLLREAEGRARATLAWAAAMRTTFNRNTI